MQEWLTEDEREQIAVMVGDGWPFWKVKAAFPERTRFAVARAIKRAKMPPPRQRQR